MMGDPMPPTDDCAIKSDPDATEDSGSKGMEGTDSAAEQNTGPITCQKCAQVYAGPSSLKRHLWRIHRLSGDEAQALVDASVTEFEEKGTPPKATTEADSDSTGSTGEVKPLLELAATPKVQSLLSLSPEPPGFPPGNFGGGPWPIQCPTGGASLPQSGLLPTPPGGHQGVLPPPPFLSGGMAEPLPPPPPPPPPTLPTTQEESSPPESAGGGKIKPLMSMSIAGDSGIRPLMSLPVLGGSPYMMSGGLSGGFYQRSGGLRRKDRRVKPYPAKDSTGNRSDGPESANDQENSSQNENTNTEKSDIGKGELDYISNSEEPLQEGPQSCTECGSQFDNPGALADHELNSHNISIDLNCDVELTA